MSRLGQSAANIGMAIQVDDGDARFICTSAARDDANTISVGGMLMAARRIAAWRIFNAGDIADMPASDEQPEGSG